MKNDDRVPRESLATRLKVLGATPGATISFCARPNQLKIAGTPEAIDAVLNRMTEALRIARPDLVGHWERGPETTTFTWTSA
jgi:hypothetical protein